MLLLLVQCGLAGRWEFAVVGVSKDLTRNGGMHRWSLVPCGQGWRSVARNHGPWLPARSISVLRCRRQLLFFLKAGMKPRHNCPNPIQAGPHMTWRTSASFALKSAYSRWESQMTRKHLLGLSCIRVGAGLLEGGYWSSRGRDKKEVRAHSLLYKDLSSMCLE